MVMTVLGPEPIDRYDTILPHEHTFIRLWAARGRFDGVHQVEDPAILAHELAALGSGVERRACVVDLTTPDLGRRPASIRQVAAASGVDVVMGCGWYREPYYRPEDRLDRRTVDDLADELVREIEVGIDGVRPGVIGEIGVDKDFVSAIEERAHRAAARAQLRSGLSLATHSLFSPVGLAQLDIFEEEGVDPGRIAIGHVDRFPYETYVLELAHRGVFLMFDNIGDPTPGYEDRVIGLIATLMERGHVGQVLLSHDICKSHQLQSHGGAGFTYMRDRFVPRLVAHGFTSAEIRLLTSDNPKAWLSGSPTH
jgi:predicted metal-dependent phosphotriesterase family hydrolase